MVGRVSGGTVLRACRTPAFSRDRLPLRCLRAGSLTAFATCFFANNRGPQFVRRRLLAGYRLRLLDQPIELFADMIRFGRGAGENDRLVERGACFLRPT